MAVSQLVHAAPALFAATVGAFYLEAIDLHRPLVKFTALTGEELG